MPTTPLGIWTPDDSDDWDLTVDLAAMAVSIDAAIDNGVNTIPQNYLIGTNAQRLALTGAALFNGLKFRTTDTNRDYIYTNQWMLAPSNRFVGRVNRSAASAIFTDSYTSLADNSFWTPNTAEGVAAYNNGWTIPETGWYNVSYELRANAPFLSGVTVNYSGSSPTLYASSSPTAVQQVAVATVACPMKLNSGDVVRPYILAASGSTPSWIPSYGHFSIEWVRA